MGGNMTSKEKGNIALGRCIQYFTSLGFIVLLPLNDAQDYDIAIDNGKTIDKIQVKYTSQKQKSNYYICKLYTCGHKDANGKQYEKPINYNNIDYFWFTNELNEDWLIPISELLNNRTITLNKDRDKFKVS